MNMMNVAVFMSIFYVSASFAVAAAGGPPVLSCTKGWDIGGVEIDFISSASAVGCASACIETSDCAYIVHFADGACALRKDPWTQPSKPNADVTQACSVGDAPLGMPRATPGVFHPGNLPAGTAVPALCAKGFSVAGTASSATTQPTLADCVGACELAREADCLAVEYDSSDGTCRLLRALYDNIMGSTGVSSVHTVCSLGGSKEVLQLHGEAKITVNGRGGVRADRVLASTATKNPPPRPRSPSPPPSSRPPSPSPPPRRPPSPSPPSPRPPSPSPPSPRPSPPPPDAPSAPPPPSDPAPPDDSQLPTAPATAPPSTPTTPPSTPGAPANAPPFAPGAPPDPFNPCPVAGRPATLTTFRCASGWEVTGTLVAPQPVGSYTPAQCEALCIANAACQFYVSYLNGTCSLRYNPWTADPYRSAPAPGAVNIACSKPGAKQALRFPQSYETCFCQWGYCYGIATCVEGFEAYGQWGFFSTANPAGFADMGMCMVGCQANPHLCSYALWYQNGADILCLARQIPYIYPTPMPDYYNVQGITGPSVRANIMCEVKDVGTMNLGAGRPNP